MFAHVLPVSCPSLNYRGFNKNANDGTEKGLAIITSFRFACRTHVNSFKYIASSTGEFYVDLWRPVGVEKYKMIWSYPVTAKQVGEVSANESFLL